MHGVPALLGVEAVKMFDIVQTRVDSLDDVGDGKMLFLLGMVVVINNCDGGGGGWIGSERGRCHISEPKR